ncbi:unannotated protein [freshwater metagenome]|uniref:Unannotated protein n=1 Tax=freshwater metagenome TaxID=449393 RepID=A0A6J5ZCP3_9ZZZZ
MCQLLASQRVSDIAKPPIAAQVGAIQSKVAAPIANSISITKIPIWVECSSILLIAKSMGEDVEYAESCVPIKVGDPEVKNPGSLALSQPA